MQFKPTTAIYEQIAAMIEDSVLSTELNEDDRLPSVRQLATDVQVNPNTVQRTFQVLQDRGVADKQRGVGYFVASGARQRILQRRRKRFEQYVLPEQFRNLALLGFTAEELAEHYERYLTENRPAQAAA